MPGAGTVVEGAGRAVVVVVVVGRPAVLAESTAAGPGDLGTDGKTDYS